MIERLIFPHHATLYRFNRPHKHMKEPKQWNSRSIFCFYYDPMYLLYCRDLYLDKSAIKIYFSITSFTLTSSLLYKRHTILSRLFFQPALSSEPTFTKALQKKASSNICRYLFAFQQLTMLLGAAIRPRIHLYSLFFSF